MTSSSLRHGQPRAPARHVSSSPRHDGLWLALFVVLSLVAVAPLFVVKRPPSHDLAQHLAAVHMLRVYPEQGLGAELELHLGRTQYIGFYALAVMLSFPFGVLLGTKVLIAAVAVAIPMGMWTLLRALGRDPRIAFFALPLTLSTPLLFGLYNYMAGIALMLFALTAAVRLAEGYGRRRAVWLSLLLSLMVLTHVVPIAFALLGCVLVLSQGSVQNAVRNLLTLVPLTLLTIAWSVFAQAAGPTSELPDFTSSRTFEKALVDLPSWITCVLESSADEQLLAVWAILLVLQVALALASGSLSAGVRRHLDLRLTALAPLALICYFALPQKHHWVYPVAARFAVLAALLSLLLLPRLTERKTTLLSLALGLVAILHTSNLTIAFRSAQKEEGDIDRAVSAIPVGRRVAAVIFRQHPKAVTLPAFRHYASLYQARKGGVVSRSFVGLPTSPFTYRNGLPPQPIWSVKAHQLDPARDFRDFEYVLVRAGPGRIGKDKAFRQVFKGKMWRVYRRSDGG